MRPLASLSTYGVARVAWLGLLLSCAQGCAEEPADGRFDPVDAADPGDPSMPGTTGQGAPHTALDGGAWDASGRPNEVARADASRAAVHPDAGCRAFVSDSLTDHACFHERMGPYRDQSASASPVVVGYDIDRPHTAYHVVLSAETPGRYAGHLTYEVRRAGAYAIFSAEVAALRVQTTAGETKDAFLAHATEICPQLPDVRGYRLEAGRHAVHVTSSHPRVTVVVEYMDEGAVEDGYRFECAPGPITPTPTPASTIGGAAPAAPPPAGAPGEDATVPSPASTSPDAPAPETRPAAPPSEPLVPAAPVAPPEPRDDPPSPSPPSPPLPAPPSPTDEGGPAAVPGQPAAASPCTVDPVLEHACLHVTHGPFATVDATSDSVTPRLLSQPHTAYTVRLTEHQSSSVSYRPTSSGEFVVYLGRDIPLTVRMGMAEQTPTFVEPVAGCDGLVRAYLYSLSAGNRYDLTFAPSAEASATVLVESVDGLTINGWANRVEACP